LFVEDIRGKECISVDLSKGSYSFDINGSYCKVLYEEGWNLIVDLTSGVVTRSFLVLLPWENYKAIYVVRGSKINLVEVSGREVYIVQREGCRVDEDSILTYILTGKGELRSKRARVSGTIVYIAWIPGVPAKYIYFITNDYIKLKPMSQYVA